MRNAMGEVQQQMKNGVETKALYIKHLPKEDWEILDQLKRANMMNTYAEVIRWVIRKIGGRL